MWPAKKVWAIKGFCWYLLSTSAWAVYITLYVRKIHMPEPSGFWGWTSFKHRNLWATIGFLPHKRFQRHYAFLHRYYCHSFSPKASRSQSCDLLLAFGKSHCNRKSCKGTAWWLLLSSHSAKVSAIFCKCNIFSTATSSPRLLVKKQRISPQPNVLPQWLQVDQVTTRAQVRFTPGMIAAAHIIPAVPNFCGQRKQSPGQGFGLQQGWLNCKHLRIWKPFQLQGQKSKQNVRNCSSFESKWQFFCSICWLVWSLKAPAEALLAFSSSAFC